MKIKFLKKTFRTLFACNLLFINVQYANAQSCEGTHNTGNAFVDYAVKARTLLKQGGNRDSLIIQLTDRFSKVEKELTGREGLQYQYSSDPDIIKYTKLRCYAVYFNFLITAKDFETIEKLAQVQYAYFSGIVPNNILCEVKGYRKKLVRKIDEDGYEYTIETNSLDVVGNINISKVAILQNTGSVVVTILMALNKTGNTTLLNKYFDAAYSAGVWVNLDGLTPVTASKYPLFGYDENKAVTSTLVNGAITYLHALKNYKMQTGKGESESDVLYYNRAKNILLNFLNADLDTTKIKAIDMNLAIIELIKDDGISNVDKANVLKKQLAFYINCISISNNAGINNELRRFNEADLFNYTNSKLLQEIWNTNDKLFIKTYIDYASSQYIWFEGVVKDVLYNIYLYARDNGFKKEAKEIYKKKFEKYYKDQYPK